METLSIRTTVIPARQPGGRHDSGCFEKGTASGFFDRLGRLIHVVLFGHVSFLPRLLFLKAF
jgi:hypothetical protein